jgi:hypothetical protein
MVGADARESVADCEVSRSGPKCLETPPPEVFIMPEPAPSPATDPALLRIDGPIATITLNRPAAFNSIDLAITKTLAAPQTCQNAAPALRGRSELGIDVSGAEKFLTSAVACTTSHVCPFP